jgi:hypothetical protein
MSMRHGGRPRAGSAALCAALVTALLGTGAVAQKDETSVAQPCLLHPSIRRTKVLDDQNILFVTSDEQAYHNLLPRQCPTMSRNAVLNYHLARDTRISELCAGNQFTVLTRVGNGWSPGFVCKLGMFRPVTEDEVADLVKLTEKEPRGRRSARSGSAPSPIETEVVELPPEDPATPAELPASEEPAP